VAKRVKPQTLIETVIAIFIMQEYEPRRFRSDRAFRFQLARRVRRLTDVNAGEYWDHVTGKVKRVYRDLAPRATEGFVRIVIEAIGGPALYLAQRAIEAANERAERELRERQRLSDALAEVR